MTFVMSSDDRLGVPSFTLAAVDTSPRVALGTIVRAYDDAGVLGDAEFMYVQASVAILSKQAVVFRNGPNNATALTLTATHANSGRPIGIALTDIAISSYGWVQISGIAIVLAVTSMAADSKVFTSATAGSLTSAAVAGTQLAGAVGASALNTPAAGQAYIQINRPNIQTQIT